jgi:DNA-binding MarR family transcriptional regulator
LAPQPRVPDASVAQIAAALARLKQLQGSRRVAALMNRAAGVELSQQEAQVLRTLGDGVVRPVAELARAAHMDVGAVSRQVRTLDERGFVTRSPSPDNGSVVLVELTPRGRNAANGLARAADRHLANSLAAWTDADRRLAGGLLARLVDDLQRTPYPAAGDAQSDHPEHESSQ